MIKFADDTCIMGLLSGSSVFDLPVYRKEIEKFVNWCVEHDLQLNVPKTKELIIDFRQSDINHEPIVINGEEVAIVEKYKYLGMIIDLLDWHAHAASVKSKINQRLYFVRKLSFFNVNKTISLFYKAVIQPVFSFCISVWGGNVNSKDKNKINKCIKTASKITNIKQENFNLIFENACNRKLTKILEDPTHQLYSLIKFSPRSGRILFFKTRRERYIRLFLPTAVRLRNQRR